MTDLKNNANNTGQYSEEDHNNRLTMFIKHIKNPHEYTISDIQKHPIIRQCTDCMKFFDSKYLQISFIVEHRIFNNLCMNCSEKIPKKSDM